MYYEKKAKELMELIPRFKKSHTHNNVEKMSRGKGFMLECLAQNGGRIMPSEMARIAGVSTARIAVFLNNAEDKGYIIRENVEGDRRKINVILTDKGKEIVKEQRKKMESQTAALLEELGEKDTEDLIRIIEKMQQIMEKHNKYENNH